MEFEDRNPKPEETNKSVPTLVLFVLIGIVCLLLYGGWYMMNDNASDASDLVKDQPTVKLPIQDSVLIDSSDLQTEPAKEPKEEAKTEQKEEPEKEEAKKEELKKEEPKKEAVELSSKESTTVTVKDGQTFLGIANKFNLSFSQLKAANPSVNPEALVVGSTKIKVPIKTVHTVGAGDILRVVGEKYGVTVAEIMAANGKTKNFAERGEKLIIPVKKK